MYELINASYQHGLRLPAELTLLAKTLFNLDAVGRALDPSFNPLDTIRDFGNRLTTERAREELSPRRILQAAAEAGDLLRQLPHRLDLLTTRLANNDFGLRVDAPQLDVLLKGMQKVANRIFSGLILAGLLIASAMLMPHRRGLATAGFWVAGGLGLYMVLTIWWNDRRGSK